MLLIIFDLPSILARIHTPGQIAFVVVILLIWLVIQIGREKWRVYRSKSWPTAAGTIAKLTSKKVWGGFNGVDYWKIQIEYTYTAAGDLAQTEYSGSYSFNVTSEEQSNGALAGLKDRTVSVHYDQRNPAKGLLWEDEVWDLWWETYWAMAHPEEAKAE
jgi:hypothetical protein